MPTFNSVSTVNAQDNTANENRTCASNQEHAILDVQVDENASETGWLLICDGVSVWDVPVGSLSDSMPGSWIHLDYCPVANTNVCNFTLFDQGTDGFIGDYGFFSLMYGAQTIASSDFGSISPFTELKYCFGPTCDTPPLEQEFVWESPFATKNNTEGSDGDESDVDNEESNDWTATVTVKDPEENDDASNTTTTGSSSNSTNDKGLGSGDSDNNSTGSTNPTSEQDLKSENESSALPGVIVGCIVGVLVVAALSFLLYKRMRRRENIPSSFHQSETEETVVAKAKEYQSSVQPSATMITKDSVDNTTVVDAV